MRVIGFAGWSGSGKTTLIAKLIPVLKARGLSVSTLKHAHHGFDIDQPGKDSFTHRLAGAQEVLVTSARRFALIHELGSEPEWPLADLIGKLAPVDLLLIEGFKREPHPKIEVYRAANRKPHLYPEDPFIRAIASDVPLDCPGRNVVPLDDTDAVAGLVEVLALPARDIHWSDNGATR